MMFFRRARWWAIFGFGILLVTLVATNAWVVVSTRAQVFRSVDDVPPRSVGLVLGTSNKTTSGKPNLFFESRIGAAAELYRRGKIERIIVSGDNRSSRYYNEPLQMKKALLAQGVPASAILLDDAGLRTRDSVVRCQSVFGESSITIITQGFHAYRALFISRHYQLQAHVLAAPAVPLSVASIRIYIREMFARSQTVFELYLLDLA